MRQNKSHVNLPSVPAAFESLGYNKWPKYEPFSRGDIWYRHGSGLSDTFHVAYLNFQPRANCYGVKLGGFNVKQLSNLEAMLPALYRYTNPKHDVHPRFSTVVGWGLFVPAREQYLSLARIPDPLDRDALESQISALKDAFLRNLFWDIDSPAKLMHMLLRNEFPFEWVIGPAAMRVAEIVALSTEVGWPVDRIKKELMRFGPLLAKRLPLGSNLNIMIDEFIGAVRQNGGT